MRRCSFVEEEIARDLYCRIPSSERGEGEGDKKIVYHKFMTAF